MGPYVHGAGFEDEALAASPLSSFRVEQTTFGDSGTIIHIHSIYQEMSALLYIGTILDDAYSNDALNAELSVVLIIPSY
jgi:hypothetical protein